MLCQIDLFYAGVFHFFRFFCLLHGTRRNFTFNFHEIKTKMRGPRTRDSVSQRHRLERLNPFPTPVYVRIHVPATSDPYRRPLCPPHAGPSNASRGRVWVSLEDKVPRPHLGSLDDPRARWPLP